MRCSLRCRQAKPWYGLVCLQRRLGEMALWKNKLCCCFCDITLPCILQLIQAVNCSTLCHELEIIVGTVKTARCKTAPWKFSEWIYRRLRIISRTKSRATQESSKEIYWRFHFVNSSETFQHLCGFQEPAERTAKTPSPEEHSAFRELWLKFVGASTNAKENLSS